MLFRRVRGRGRAGRRRSKRWKTDKPIEWRIYRGRRIRDGRVIERSLEGLVLAAAGDAPASPGMRFFVSGPSPIEQHGFKSAVVRRTAIRADGRRLMFAEIEA